MPGALAVVVTAVAALAAEQRPAMPSASAEWRVYGGSNASDRYSPLDEITPANVQRLEEVWRFDTGETGGFQVNPIVVHGVVYSPTPNHRVVALDAATGQLKWTFDSKLESRGPNRDDRRGTPPQIPALTNLTSSAEQLTTVIRRGVGRMPGFPNLSPEAVRALVGYLRNVPGHGEASAPKNAAPEASSGRLRFTGYKKFLDPDGYPATAPPWGTLNAIDLNTGAFAWRIPLGEYPELAASGMTDTGSENYGGPIVTAGGVLFIGATNFDRKFRAFEAATGRLLWQVTLPFAANTTPATYEVAGHQYVVVAAGGGKSREPSGGIFIAYRLPRDAQKGRSL